MMACSFQPVIDSIVTQLHELRPKVKNVLACKFLFIKPFADLKPISRYLGKLKSGISSGSTLFAKTKSIFN